MSEDPSFLKTASQNVNRSRYFSEQGDYNEAFDYLRFAINQLIFQLEWVEQRLRSLKTRVEPPIVHH
jgi:hypothetical protein